MDFVTWRTPNHQPRKQVRFRHVPWGIEVHHTVTQVAEDDADLITRCRGIYNHHVKTNGWWDGWYNFLIASNGSIAAMRGWDYAPYSDDGGPDSQLDRLAVALIGNYNHYGPTKAQKASLYWLDQELRRRQKATGTRFQGHGYHQRRDATSCPGTHVINLFKKNELFVPDQSSPKPTPAPAPSDDSLEVNVSSLPTLRRGDGYNQGPGDREWHQVRNLQALLIAHAPDLMTVDDVDGLFGPRTETVLKQWQVRTEYLATHEKGYCGPKTWKWLIGV